jgi:hypothetical protein
MKNEFLSLTVLPELGAKIYDMIYLPLKRNLLWHNPRVPPRKAYHGARFDDYWCGGWDEIFPNDAETIVNGERYPDMGEIWSLDWDYQINQQRNLVSLLTSVSCPISPVEVIREVKLAKAESGMKLRYQIKNLSKDAIKFLWKLHPAFEINDSCEIEIPAKRGIIDPRYQKHFSSRSYAWPDATYKGGSKVNVSKVTGKLKETCTLHYLTDLSDGYATFKDRKNGVQCRISFPKDVLDNVWLFLAYGGWRSLYNLVLEPSTSYPYDLNDAIKQNTVGELDGGKKLDVTIGVDAGPLDPPGR